MSFFISSNLPSQLFFLIILKLRRGSPKVSRKLTLLLHVWSILTVHFCSSFVVVLFFSLWVSDSVFTACGSCSQLSGEPMALEIATGKREEVVTLIFSDNVNKGQRTRVGVDAEALVWHDFQTSVLLKFVLMFFPSCPFWPSDGQDKWYQGWV